MDDVGCFASRHKRMGRVSWSTRRRGPPVPHTHALFADQSQSIPDNLMALLGAVRAWHCSGKAARVPVACYLAHSRFRVLSRHALMVPVLLDMTHCGPSSVPNSK